MKKKKQAKSSRWKTVNKGAVQKSDSPLRKMLVPYLRLSNSGKYVSLLDCNTVDSQLACATENSAAIEMTYGAGMEISRSIKSRTIPSHRDSVVSIGAIGDCHLADVGCTHDGTGHANCRRWQ